MSGNLVTVEQAARQLSLHPKTVLRHIREGRLRGTRLGKAYRIAQADLDAFAGLDRGDDRSGDARATCTVDVHDISAEVANRIALYLGAASMTGNSGSPPLHVSTAFDPGLRVLKVVAIGDPADVSRLLGMFEMLRS